jgi:L-fucose mutarotase
MGALSGDQLDPSVEASYQQAIDQHWPNTPPIQHIDRFDFYERAEQALTVLMTGETARDGNIILIKGVIPITRK